MRYICALVALATVVGLATCSSAAPLRSNSNDCVKDDLINSRGLDLFPPSRQAQSAARLTSEPRGATVRIAQLFDITYYSTFKVLRNLYTFASESYVLYQCGAPRPDPAQYGLDPGTKAFAVPLGAVAVADTTVLGFLKVLRVQDRVSYVTPFAVDACMQALASSACNRSNTQATPDTMDGIFGFGANRADPLAISFTATADPSPLNRAEHIKYIATFFNREAEANTVFQGIADSYAATKQAVAGYKEAEANASSPLVAWLYYQPPYISPSYNSSEQVILSAAGVRRPYTEDAGGRLPDLAELDAQYGNGLTVRLGGGPGSQQLVFTDLPTTLPVLRAILRDVDVLIDESYYANRNPADITPDDFRTLYGLSDGNASGELPFLRTQRLLRLDGTSSPTGSTSWFEDAVARPDVVLSELARAFFPAPPLPLVTQGGAGALGLAAPQNLVRSLFASGPTRGVDVTTAAQCPAALARCSLGPASPICPNVHRNCSGALTIATEQQPCAPVCGSPAKSPSPAVAVPSPGPSTGPGPAGHHGSKPPPRRAAPPPRRQPPGRGGPRAAHPAGGPHHSG